MTSSQLILFLSGLLAIVVGQCPPGNCPPPVDPPNCGPPDCGIPTNRYHPNALFPAEDPNYFWQCAPTQVGVWEPLLRLCACGSVFNAFENPRRCTFWFDKTWAVPPGCPWVVPPILRPCDPWCPDCNGPTTTGPTTTESLPLVPEPPTTTTSVPTTTTSQNPGDPWDTTTTSVSTTTPSPCGCPPGCPPCIWWPCRPCVPCWCRQGQEAQNPMLNWQ